MRLFSFDYSFDAQGLNCNICGSNGTVVTWGDEYYGGDSSAVRAKIQDGNVTMICANKVTRGSAKTLSILALAIKFIVFGN